MGSLASEQGGHVGAEGGVGEPVAHPSIRDRHPPPCEGSVQSPWRDAIKLHPPGHAQARGSSGTTTPGVEANLTPTVVEVS
jgi:hypothetical protein